MINQILDGDIRDALYASNTPSDSNPFITTTAFVLANPLYVIVKAESDFPAPVAGIITLDNNKNYIIQGTVIINNRLVIGTSNMIMGFDKSTDILVYTGAGVMISGTNQSFAIRELTCIAGTPGSSIFGLSGTVLNNYEIRECIFANSKALGTISGFGVCVFQKNFITRSDTGLIIGTAPANDLIIIDNYFEANNNIAGCKFINILATSIFSDIVISRNHFGTLANETGVVVGAITIAEFGKMLDNTFHSTGTSVSGISYASTGWLFQGNSDVLNTVANGQIGFVDNVTTTSVNNTAIAINGTWLLKSGNNKFDSPSNGIIRYTDKEPASIKVEANLCAFGASTFTCELTIWKNGVQQNESKMGFTVYTAREFVTVQFLDNSAVQNDQYQLRLRKTTAGAVTTTVIDVTLSAVKI